ncbi:transposase [Roseovarius sp. MBR-38]|jgi:transposase
MDKVTILGIDLAKSVFQLHGVDVEGRVLLRRQLRRSQMLEFFQRLPPCAYSGTSAHPFRQHAPTCSGLSAHL